MDKTYIQYLRYWLYCSPIIRWHLEKNSTSVRHPLTALPTLVTLKVSISKGWIALNLLSLFAPFHIEILVLVLAVQQGMRYYFSDWCQCPFGCMIWFFFTVTGLYGSCSLLEVLWSYLTPAWVVQLWGTFWRLEWCFALNAFCCCASICAQVFL